MTNLLVLFLGLISSISTAEDTGLWTHAKESIYTKASHTLYDEIKAQKKSLKIIDKDQPLKLFAIPTLTDKTFIGILATVTIHAPLERVVQVFQDTDHYGVIYTDLEQIKVIKRDRDDMLIDWSFTGPMGTHTKYQTVQRIEKMPDRASVIYQLISSDKVTASDGFVFMKELNGVTHYLSVDFFNADWGGLASLFSNLIWKKSCIATAKTTFLIQMIAEKREQKLTASNGFGSEEMLEDCVTEDRKKERSFEKLRADFFD